MNKLHSCFVGPSTDADYSVRVERFTPIWSLPCDSGLTDIWEIGDVLDGERVRATRPLAST